jgi:hypothetical protein
VQAPRRMLLNDEALTVDGDRSERLGSSIRRALCAISV